MTLGRLGGFAAVAIGPLGWCVALGALVDGDPMLGVEIAGAALAVIWAGLVILDVTRCRRLAVALSASAVEASLFDIPVRITRRLGADAIVVGSLRPRIFVGHALLVALTDDELQAVVYHEDHHRRMRAPLRASALEAWLRLLGWSRRVRDVVLDRLADLETLADADAIRRGSSPRSLARALVKGDPSPQPASFAYAADRRVGQLLDHAAGVALAP
jgi:hypothetical protein